MFPELGKYAVTILSSYGAAISILAVLIAVYVLRNARIRRALAAAEARKAAR